jgi:hypothetical protein
VNVAEVCRAIVAARMATGKRPKVMAVTLDDAVDLARELASWSLAYPDDDGPISALEIFGEIQQGELEIQNVPVKIMTLRH